MLAKRTDSRNIPAPTIVCRFDLFFLGMNNEFSKQNK